MLGKRVSMSELAGGPVPTYEIKVRLNRRPSDGELDTLRTHADGADVDRDGHHAMVRFSRETETLSAAIAEAMADVATVPGLQVYWVEPLESRIEPLGSSV